MVYYFTPFGGGGGGGGVYIQPENTKYFNLTMFVQIDEILSDYKRYNYTPLIAGDFKSQIGDIDYIYPTTWNFKANCDAVMNKHGMVHLSDLCKRNKVFPLHHIQYKDKIFHGDFTYEKSHRKSEIDFVLTDDTSRGLVTKFQINTVILIDYVAPADILLIRAEYIYCVYVEHTTVQQMQMQQMRVDSKEIENRFTQNEKMIEDDIINAICDNHMN